VTTRLRTVDTESLPIDATRTLMANNPDLPIKLDLGNRHPETTPAADKRPAWYVLIEPTNTGMRVSGAGPRRGGWRPTVVGEPVVVDYPSGPAHVSVLAFAVALDVIMRDQANMVAVAWSEARR